MVRIECKCCRLTFLGKRRDAVTCSARCRQRYKRRCDRIAQVTTGERKEVKEYWQEGTPPSETSSNRWR